MKRSGIYRIVNGANGRVYVGSAVNLKSRKEDHWKTLRAGRHRNRFLQRAWDKYGADQFSFEVIEDVKDKDRLLEREQFHLDQLSFESHDPMRCYNICRTAGSLLGTKRTVECRARMSALKLGKPRRPEDVARHAAMLRGRKKSPESIAKRTASRIGFRQSDEAKAKISAAKTGVKQSAEAVEKRAAALRGRVPSDAHKLALREANRSFTQEQVDDMVRRRKDGETYPSIAKDYGTTKDTVRNWCLREGLEKVNVYISDERRAEIVRRREAGESLSSIAQSLHVSEATVLRMHRAATEAEAIKDQTPRTTKEPPRSQLALL